MNELANCIRDQYSENCNDPFVLATTGLQVVVLNRARDIIVKVAIDLPFWNLNWEGRDNLLLLYWEDTRFFTRIPVEGVKRDASVFGRPILLPCDVDFSNAVWALNANHLMLRIPKCIEELVQGPARSAHFCLNDESWIESDAPGQLAENRVRLSSLDT